MIDDKQAAVIEQRAKRIAANTKLDTDEELNAAVEAQLNRITKPPIAKRRATIRAFAEAEITPGMGVREIFGRKDTVGMRSFYGTDKNWYHDPLFREVLETVKALYVRWHNGRETRELARRRDEFNEEIFKLADLMKKKAIDMFSSELFEVVITDEVEVGPDGEERMVQKITMVPSRWTMDTAVRAAKTAAELGQMALGMPTVRSESSVKWEQHLPPGMTREQVEAAKQALIERMLADMEVEGTAVDDGEDEEE